VTLASNNFGDCCDRRGDEPNRFITKLEGVRHVLHSAIRCQLAGEDPFAVHILAQSAEKVDWGVTGTTQRLLEHWRNHEFVGPRPFFCQIETVETIIWLTEVAPKRAATKGLLDQIAKANEEANPALFRLAMKMAMHRETLALPKVARSFLQGNAAEPLKTTENDADMLERACGKLLNYDRVNVDQR
jgi:hypothetical protein